MLQVQPDQIKYWVKVKGPITINGALVRLGDPVTLTEAVGKAFSDFVSDTPPKTPPAENKPANNSEDENLHIKFENGGSIKGQPTVKKTTLKGRAK